MHEYADGKQDADTSKPAERLFPIA
jgi:hypothetical protein